MRRIDYDDFCLVFEPVAGEAGRFQVRVAGRPAGGTPAIFCLPYRPEEADAVLGDLEHRVRESGGTRDFDSPGAPRGSEGDPERIGRLLFETLFRDGIRESFLLARERAVRQPGGGMRVRLSFDLDHPGTAALASLPWELLYRHETRDFLARDPATPVVRFLSTGRYSAAEPLHGKLRILLAWANPVATGRLDLAGEADRLRDVWQDSADAEVSLLPRASVQSLHDTLRDEPFHVLHLMGHGGFCPHSGKGAVLLEGTGSARHVPGAVLADSVKAARGLRMVFLNACDTARFSRRHGQDPFTGTGTALVMAGVPAVVAMQFPVSDAAAIELSRALYAALAAGDPVDAAVTEGRLAVHRQTPDSWEWATPVLFLSAPGGRLFVRASEERTERMRDINVTGASNRVVTATDGSTVTIHEAVSAREEAARSAQIGVDSLRLGAYGAAAHHLQAAVDRGLEDSEADYRLALAVLGGRRPKALTPDEARRLRERLELAVARRPSAHALLLLAFLKHDYFAANRLRVPPPDPELLVQQAKQLGLDRERLAELQAHAPIDPFLATYLGAAEVLR